ncbi:MAG: hypothetical protein PHV97_07040, partial [Candidatus Omnitrophica bacterium]|nr:hypothetical protein [Candidatus Omnitrophota bacterium]
MRIKNFLIFFIAFFLSVAFSSFAQEDTPAGKVKPVADSTSEVKPVSQPVAESKPEVKAVSETKPAPLPAVEVKPAIEPSAEVKPAVQPIAGLKPVVNVTSEAKPAVSPAIEVKLASKPAAPIKPVINSFAEEFFAPAPQKLDHQMSEVRGFPILKSHSREQDAEFSIVTDFGGGAVKSRYLSGLKD